MKIYIITRHDVNNYGSVLQAYATQKYFESLGYESYIINYCPKNERIIKLNRAFAKAAYPNSKLKQLFYRIVKFPGEFIAHSRFRRFQRKLLTLTHKFSTLNELKLHDFKDSILCAGSDQIWGYISNSVDKAYYLDFGTNKNKFISYSASFGRVDFDEQYMGNLQNLLSKFSFISVREQSAVKLIEEHTTYEAYHILDPILMMPQNFWRSFVKGKERVDDYIVVYELHNNKNLDNYLAAVLNKYHCRVIRISASIYTFFEKGKKAILKSPANVMRLIRDAKFIITDSFHATVFSIIFEKNFVNVLPPKTFKRITDLAEMLKLNDRILNEPTENDLQLLEKNIDYMKVNMILADKRTECNNIIISKMGELR